MRRATAILFTCVFVLFTTAVGHAQNGGSTQQPAATFRADVNFVEIHAVVTDARGDFVRDLTKDDFEIYESGKLQRPTVLQLVDTPPVTRPTAVDTSSAEPDVRETTKRFEAAARAAAGAARQHSGRRPLDAADDLRDARTRGRRCVLGARPSSARYQAG